MNLSRKLAILIFLGVFISVTWATLLVLPLIDPYIKMQTQGFFEIVLFTILKLIILTIVIVLPVTATIWVLITKSIIKPLGYFNEVTRSIASGNLGKKIEFISKDELGELGENINLMVKNLATAFQSMASSLRNEKLKEKELEVSYTRLEKEKAKDEALLTNINDAVIGINKDSRIILFNKAASNLTGFDQNEAINMPYYWVLKFLGEKDGVALDFINQAFSGIEQKNSNHVVIEKRDKGKIPVSHSVGVIRTGGQVTGAVVVLRDITRERELEQMKDEFVSIASHELRTPMTAIKGLISMIFEGDFGNLSTELKDPLSDIATSTDRLISLVNDMLDVSRIEAGRLKFILGEYVVSDLIDEILVLMEPLTKEKGVGLESTGELERKVFTDANKFKQILSNLVGNAIKFTDHGKITVEAKLNGELLKISVSDTGMGISKEDQKKLFTKFSQITDSQSGRPKGTGLGLYISKEFAKKLGGDLWIENSVPGYGSIFSFSSPLSGTNMAKKVDENFKKPIEAQIKI